MIITDETALILSAHQAQARSLADQLRGWLVAKPPVHQGVSEAYLTAGARPWLAGVQSDSGGWLLEAPETHPVSASSARRAA